VTKVTLTLQDKAGKGLGDSEIDVQLCGSNLCLYGKSSDGKYLLPADGKATELVDPALKYGSQAANNYLFWGGAVTSATVDYGTVNAVKLGPAGGQLLKGATVTSNDVSVVFAANANVEQDLAIPSEGFRAVVFKPSDGNFAPLAATTQKFDLLVGMGPAEVDICPPAKLIFPNVGAWPAKTAVELWLNGVKTYDHWVPYGAWGKVADGVVSDDGKTVSTKDGSGIPATGAYGIVKK